MRRAAFLLVILALAGCGGGNGSGSPVELVVPKGYTGTVWLLLDPNGEDIPIVDGQYRITVPAGGVMRVRSLKHMEQWHALSARYDDGTAIRSDDISGARIGPDVVAVRGIWSGVSQPGGREYQRIFIGTAAERKEMPERQDIPGIDK